MRAAAPVAQKAAMDAVAEETAQAGAGALAASSPEIARETATQAVQYSAQQPIGLWFAAGAAAFLLLYLLFDYVRRRKSKLKGQTERAD